jgi:hypothetical protein
MKSSSVRPENAVERSDNGYPYTPCQRYTCRASNRQRRPCLLGVVYWVEKKRWPKKLNWTEEENSTIERLLAWKKSSSSLSWKRSNSVTSTTPSDQRPREEKRALPVYRNARYALLLQTKGLISWDHEDWIDVLECRVFPTLRLRITGRDGYSVCQALAEQGYVQAVLLELAAPPTTIAHVMGRSKCPWSGSTWMPGRRFVKASQQSASLLGLCGVWGVEVSECAVES